MGNATAIGERVRQQLRAERERRGWTQRELAMVMSKQGIPMHHTTVAKIEAGDRACPLDALVAFATLFGISTDVFLGRDATGTDVAWAMSKMATESRKLSIEIASMRQRISAAFQDVRFYATRDRKTVSWVGDVARQADEGLAAAQRALGHLDFPAIVRPGNDEAPPAGASGASR